MYDFETYVPTSPYSYADAIRGKMTVTPEQRANTVRGYDMGRALRNHVHVTKFDPGSTNPVGEDGEWNWGQTQY